MLNEKQQRFVDEYLVDLNATQAALRAGYSAKTAYAQGCRLLKHAEVLAELSKRREKREQRTNITQDYVLEVLRETVDRCRQVEQVRDALGNPVLGVTRDGKSVAAVFEFNPKGVLQGASLLMDHLGMKRTKVEHTGKDGGAIQLSTETREEVVENILTMLGVTQPGDASNGNAKGHASSNVSGRKH